MRDLCRIAGWDPRMLPSKACSISFAEGAWSTVHSLRSALCRLAALKGPVYAARRSPAEQITRRKSYVWIGQGSKTAGFETQLTVSSLETLAKWEKKVND